mmetsp:Transcript_34278/g.58014  ORF Transcript_34278/g.58014 Transcript_34278/m.58014 type:complete len:494 (-) Transcript_34278:387-1868(-)
MNNCAGSFGHNVQQGGPDDHHSYQPPRPLHTTYILQSVQLPDDDPQPHTSTQATQFSDSGVGGAEAVGEGFAVQSQACNDSLYPPSMSSTFDDDVEYDKTRASSQLLNDVDGAGDDKDNDSERKHVWTIRPDDMPREFLLRLKYKRPVGGWKMAKLKEVLRPACFERKIQFPNFKNPRKHHYVTALKEFDGIAGFRFEEMKQHRWSASCYARMFEAMLDERANDAFNQRDRAPTRDEKKGKGLMPWDYAFTKLAEVYNDPGFRPLNIRPDNVYVSNLDPSDISCIPKTAAVLSDKWKSIRGAWEQTYVVDYDVSKNGKPFDEFAFKTEQGAALIYLHFVLQDSYNKIKTASPMILALKGMDVNQSDIRIDGDGNECNHTSSSRSVIAVRPNKNARKRKGKYERYGHRKSAGSSSSVSDDMVRVEYAKKLKTESISSSLRLVTDLEHSITKYENILDDELNKGTPEDSRKIKRIRRILAAFEKSIDKAMRSMDV